MCVWCGQPGFRIAFCNEASEFILRHLLPEAFLKARAGDAMDADPQNSFLPKEGLNELALYLTQDSGKRTWTMRPSAGEEHLLLCVSHEPVGKF